MHSVELVKIAFMVCHSIGKLIVWQDRYCVLHPFWMSTAGFLTFWAGMSRNLSTNFGVFNGVIYLELF